MSYGLACVRWMCHKVMIYVLMSLIQLKSSLSLMTSKSFQIELLEVFLLRPNYDVVTSLFDVYIYIYSRLANKKQMSRWVKQSRSEWGVKMNEHNTS